jgi:hypothetical protein
MTIGSTDDEGAWLASIDAQAKAVFLASLGHCLTIAGRGTYEPRTAGLTRPDHLRQVNEIQHRVLACLRETLAGTGNASFERSIAHWVLDVKDRLLAQDTTWAWESAKNGLSKKQMNASSPDDERGADTVVTIVIRNCKLGAKCSAVWESLRGDSPAYSRHCDECDRDVLWCDTPARIMKWTMLDSTVAFDAEAHQDPALPKEM